MEDSLISGNIASNPEHNRGTGGDIYFYRYFSLSNVTITGNTAGGNAGAFFLDYLANGTFDHMTIAGNDTYNPAQARILTGGAVKDIDRFEVRNSIITGPANAQETCRFDDTTKIISAGRSLVSDTSCLDATVNLLKSESEAKLGSLRDNGEPTQTLALLPGSPAIDASLPVDEMMDPKLDQRGFGCQGTADIGAFERLSSSRAARRLTRQWN